ncbi:hypothetical protein D3C71_1907960 [compost metagenome]
MSIIRSMKWENASERFLAMMKATPAPITRMRMAHHHWIMNSLMPITIKVKAGRSAPKLWNVALNCGTTNTSRIALTRIATAMTVAG